MACEKKPPQLGRSRGTPRPSVPLVYNRQSLGKLAQDIERFAVELDNFFRQQPQFYQTRPQVVGQGRFLAFDQILQVRPTAADDLQLSLPAPDRSNAGRVASLHRLTADGAVTVSAPGALINGETSYVVADELGRTDFTFDGVNYLADRRSGPGDAPVDAFFLVSAADSTLTNERVVANSTDIAWDFGTAGAASASFASRSALSVIGRSAGTAGLPADIDAASGSGHVLRESGGALDFGAVSIAALADIADDTFLANISGSAAPPTAVALTTLAGAGLTGGADAILAVGAGTGITVNANDVQLTSIADDTFMANVSGGAAVATGKTFTSLAGDGLAYDATNHELDVTGSTSITVTSDQVQRAALTGAIAASLNSNATVFAGILDNGSAENNRTNLNFVSGTNTTAVVTDDSGNDELEISFSVDDLPITALADIATNRILGRVTAGTGAVEALTSAQAQTVINSHTSVSWGGSTTTAVAISPTGTNATVSLATPGSGELDLTAGGLIDINAGAGLDVDVTGAVTVDSTTSQTFTAGTTLSLQPTGNLILKAFTGVLRADSGVVSVDSDVSDLVTKGWDDVLAVDAHTGANNPLIDAGQYLGFEGGTLPGSGHIRLPAGVQWNIIGRSTAAATANVFRWDGTDDSILLGESTDIASIQVSCATTFLVSNPALVDIRGTNVAIRPSGIVNLGRTTGGTVISTDVRLDATGDVEVLNDAHFEVLSGGNAVISPTGNVQLKTFTGVLRADSGIVSVDTDVSDLVTKGWDDVLAVDRSSGANNPLIATSQYIEFDTGTGFAAATLGNLRSDGDFIVGVRDSAGSAFDTISFDSSADSLWLSSLNGTTTIGGNAQTVNIGFGGGSVATAVNISPSAAGADVTIDPADNVNIFGQDVLIGDSGTQSVTISPSLAGADVTIDPADNVNIYGDDVDIGDSGTTLVSFNNAGNFDVNSAGSILLGDATATDAITLATAGAVTVTGGSGAAVSLIAQGTGDIFIDSADRIDIGSSATQVIDIDAQAIEISSVVDTSIIPDGNLNLGDSGTDNVNVAAAGYALDIQDGAMAFSSSAIATNTSTGSQTAWNPGVGTATIWRWNGASGATIEGIAAPAAGRGAWFFGFNVSGSVLEFNNEDTSATAANRILTSTGANIGINQQGFFWGWYDHASSRWRVTGLD